MPKPGYPLDGVSFVSVLKNPAAPYLRPPIMWHFPGYLPSYVHRGAGLRTGPVGAIHSGDFKLMEFFESDKVELYDLREDLGERHDLAAQMPDKVKELTSQLAAWRARVHAAMPTMKTQQQLKAEQAKAASQPKERNAAGGEDHEK